MLDVPPTGRIGRLALPSSLLAAAPDSTRDRLVLHDHSLVAGNSPKDT